jgi:hypothetical protein
MTALIASNMGEAELVRSRGESPKTLLDRSPQP